MSDAIIKVRLDTGAAEADLRRLESAMSRAAAAGRMGMGGGGGGGLGGILGGGLKGLLPMIGGISLGAAAFGTTASDAFSVAHGSLDWIGRGLSSMTGLAGLHSNMKSIDRAAAMTAQAFGPTAPSDEAIKRQLSAFRKITDREEAVRRRVEDIAAVDKRDEVVKKLDEIFNWMKEQLKAPAKAALDALPDDFYRWWGNTFGY